MRRRDGADLLEARFEGYVGSGAAHTGLEVRSDGDTAGYTAFVGVGHLADVWVSVGSPALSAWRYRRTNKLSADVNVVSLRVHDGAVWWELWHPRHEWKSGTPRLRYGNLNVVDLLFGKAEHSSVPRGDAVVQMVPMPEGSYPALVELTRDSWKRPRWLWPKVVDRADVTVLAEVELECGHRRVIGAAEQVTVFLDVGTRSELPAGRPPEPGAVVVCGCHGEHTHPARVVEVTSPGYIPEPGKGENSWDCGPDGTFAMSTPARTVGQAIGQVVASVLDTRARRGGAPDYSERIQ